MPLSSTLLILSGTLIIMLLWHGMENEQLRHNLLQEQVDPGWIRRLTRFAWLRTAQIVLILGSAIILINTYEQNARQTDTSIIDLQHQLAETTALLKDAQSELIARNATPVAPEEPPATHADAPIAQGIEAVFGVPSGENVQQKAFDSLKRRYEGLLVSYKFLKKCKQTKPEDFHIINSAMMQEIASVNAPGRLQYDILTAANGSYTEIYAASRCDQAGTKSLAENFRKYIDNLTAHAE